MNYTTQKGLITEIECQKDFASLGILLSQPIINDSRYDFLADIQGKIIKIQCKAASSVDDENSAIMFNCSSKNWNNGEYHSYVNDIDYFYTSWNGQGFLIPVKDAGTRSTTLRLIAKKVNNNPNTKWAKDYEIERILKKDFNYEVPIFTKPNQEVIKEEKKYCIDCGAEISKTAVRCQSCAHKARQTVNRPEREELKQLIRSTSFTEIGKNFGVSDNAIKRWCDSYNLPRTKKEIAKYSNTEWESI